jgi:hypothetical protein
MVLGAELISLPSTAGPALGAQGSAEISHRAGGSAGESSLHGRAWRRTPDTTGLRVRAFGNIDPVEHPEAVLAGEDLEHRPCCAAAARAVFRSGRHLGAGLAGVRRVQRPSACARATWPIPAGSIRPCLISRDTMPTLGADHWQGPAGV